MTEGTTNSPDPDVSPTDNSVENSGETEAGQGHSGESSDDATNMSAMARALKHTLEQKSMAVEVEDDGETLRAEKLDQTYHIHPDGTVDGNGVLRDGIIDIIADLNADHETAVENSEVAPEPEPEPDPDDEIESGEDNGANGNNGDDIHDSAPNPETAPTVESDASDEMDRQDDTDG